MPLCHDIMTLRAILLLKIKLINNYTLINNTYMRTFIHTIILKIKSLPITVGKFSDFS